MTNNIDRAARILYDEGVGDGDAGYYYAHRLADAGLLAPDLHEWHAPAAVAEVIRLRKAMEAVRDDCRRNAEAAAWLAQGSTDSLEPVFSELADALTRILEGETND